MHHCIKAIVAALSVVLALRAVFAAAAYLPETSPRTIVTSPLNPGEVAVYSEPTKQTATIYVGGPTGELRRVTEPATLHGYRIEEIPLDELAVTLENVTNINGQWCVTSRHTTGYVTFHTRGGERIEDYTFNSGMDMDGLNVGTITDTCGENWVRFKIECVNSPRGWVSDVRIRRIAFGDVKTVNDLRDTTFILRDDIGEIDFTQLRPWARDLYNGNRGEDWAGYKPKCDANMDGKKIVFAEKGRYAMTQDANTNLVVQAGGYDAITVSFRGASGAEGSFRVIAFDIDKNKDQTGDVEIKYTIDADELNTEAIGVEFRESLTSGSWAALPSSAFSVNGNTISIPNHATRSSGFYRVTYGGNVMSNVIEIHMRGKVVVEDELILKGTDDIYYKITVNGGVISATPVN